MENEAPDTLRDAILYFADFEHCRRFMMELRWPDGKVTCPRCGAEKVTWLEKARVWKCYAKHERPTFTLKTGTIFEESPISLEKWLPAAWLVINCKNGISSYELSRDLKVTQKTAWFMLHRVRLAMQSGTFEKFTGEVEADESFLGGKLKNMHTMKKIRKYIAGEINQGGYAGKAIVMGLLERNSKQVRATVMPDIKKVRTDAQIKEHVAEGSTLYTDEATIYRSLPDYVHEFVDHSEAYVKDAVHVNGLENFWSLLKRGLSGTYISVEPFHLQAYVDEQAFRYNNRKLSDGERFAAVMKQIVGRRLTYAQLTGKTEDAYS